MEPVLQQTLQIRGPHCDLFRRARPDALFMLMQEAGEQHALRGGFGYADMASRGLFFVLTRAHLSVARPPRFGETVIHETWVDQPNHFFCPRYHTFSLPDGTLLASAAALWIMLDMENRKVVSPAKSGVLFPDNGGRTAPVAMPLRIPQHLDPEKFTLREPRYSDYDVNGHVNNTRYIAWLSDAAGLEFQRDHFISDLVCGYDKEIRDPDPLRVRFEMSGDAFEFGISSQSDIRHFTAAGSFAKDPEPCAALY